MGTSAWTRTGTQSASTTATARTSTSDSCARATVTPASQATSASVSDFGFHWQHPSLARLKCYSAVESSDAIRTSGTAGGSYCFGVQGSRF